MRRVIRARLTRGAAPGYLPEMLPRRAGLLRAPGKFACPGPSGVSTMNQAIGIAALLAVLAAPAGAAHLPQTEPDPSLSPQDVVSIQVEALEKTISPMKIEG